MPLLEKSFKYGEKDYTMKEMVGEEDLAFIHMLTNQLTGKVNMRDLWLKRLTRCLVSPKMTESDLVQLPSKELQTLIQCWLLMNEPDTTNFLEASSSPSGNTL